MKKVSVLIDVYEKGDRVCTAEGMATLLEDEIIPENPFRSDLAYSEVDVRLDEHTSSHTDGLATMETTNFIIEDEEMRKRHHN